MFLVKKVNLFVIDLFECWVFVVVMKSKFLLAYIICYGERKTNVLNQVISETYEANLIYINMVAIL